MRLTAARHGAPDSRQALWACALATATALAGAAQPHAAMAAPTLAARTTAAPSISVQVTPASGAFTVAVNGAPWFSSPANALAVTLGGRTYSISDGSLTLNSSTATSGTDALGAYSGTTVAWLAGATPFETRFRQYAASAAVVLEQAFPDGAEALNVGHDYNNISTHFPVFDLAASAAGNGGTGIAWDSAAMGPRATADPAVPPARGYSQWASFGTPGTSPNNAGTWPAHGPSALAGSWKDNTGALAVFDSDMTTTVVLSPLSTFDAWQQNYDDAGQRFLWGVRGGIEAVDPGFTAAMVLVASSGGVNTGMRRWGDVLLASVGRVRDGAAHLVTGQPVRSRWRDDLSLTTLGYTTANGAYYYYCTEPSKDYQDTILDVKAYTQQIDLPVQWILIDSWWYTKSGGTGPDPSNGVTNWTDADPKVFPAGLAYVWEHTGWPMVAHNRAWSSVNVYLKDYAWALGKDLSGDTIALPLDQQFWDDLFGAVVRKGIINHQLDWQYTQQGQAQLQGNTSLDAMWMRQMNAALDTHGMHFGHGGVRMNNWLSSVAYPTVTNGRATNDYMGNRSSQWALGVSATFTSAIDVMPAKDGFWTTGTQDGNCYALPRVEPYPRLHAASATLSCGPVSPSDKIGATDRDLVMRSCRADGVLLQPTEPVTAIDAQYLHAAFGSGSADATATVGAAGQLWSARTLLGAATTGGALTYYHILAADMAAPFSLVPSQLQLADAVDERGYGTADGTRAPAASQTYVVFENSNATAANSTVAVAAFSALAPLAVPVCGRADFRLWHASPVLGNGWALLGETSKWVPVAAARIVRVDVVDGGDAGADAPSGDSDVQVTIVGVADEAVTLSFVDPTGGVRAVSCTLSATRRAVVSAAQGTCVHA